MLCSALTWPHRVRAGGVVHAWAGPVVKPAVNPVRNPPGCQQAGSSSIAVLRAAPHAIDMADTQNSGGGPTRSGEEGLRCRVKVGSADSILAVIPHLLGFHPSDSLVVLGIGGPHARIRLAFRYDLPHRPYDGTPEGIASHACTVLKRERLTIAVAVGYGPGPAVTPVVDAVAPALKRAGIALHDVLRVQDGRYWSYLCEDPACCPPEGVPFDQAGHPAATALSAAGLAVLADRGELAATIAPDATSAEPMKAAVQRAHSRAERLTSESLSGPNPRDAYVAVADSGRRSVRQAIATYRRGGELTDLDEIAWLGLTLRDLRVRDDAWARMAPNFAGAHMRLWTELVRCLPAELVAGPAALLAFASWQSGEGALASIAIERSLEADPAYSMALLLAEALNAGLPPSAARLPMTPKQVAATYARMRPRSTRPRRRTTS